VRQLLETEREALTRQVARARAAGPVQLDQTAVGRLSRMDALMNQALAQGSELRAVQELALVEDALERLERGTYGFCHSCLLPIALERLLVIPEARDCTRCRAR
jgi:DnaK suppressor protein